MKTITRLMLVSALMIFAAPASSDVREVFYCSEDEDVSEEVLEAVAAKWLEAARKMKGGEDLQLYLHFPVVGVMGENDFAMVVQAPDLKTWGEFWDGYPDSPIEKIDDELHDLADCTDSTLYESHKIE